MTEKKKTKYSILQNMAYAVGTVWKYSRLLLVMETVGCALGFAIHFLQLYITPVILQKVEQAAPMGDLLAAIALFTLLLLLAQSLKAYVEETKNISGMRVRDGMSIDLMRRSCMTAYPNQLDSNFRGVQDEAFEASIGSRDTSLDVMFPQTLELLTAVLGFALYLLILQDLNMLLMTVVVLTSVISYLAGKRANEWAYRHRKESVQIRLKRNYVINLAMGNEMPKDIRIFGMRKWLDAVYDGITAQWKSFSSRQEKNHMKAKGIDAALSFLRNGIAYIYLIRMALEQELSAAQFLLYFSAVTGFTAWITTILNSLAALQKTSLQISAFREYMQWPEPFRFEDGNSVRKEDFDSFELSLENVSFRYGGSEKDIIRNMDLTVAPGEKLAIVGLNGAGKTTLVKLMAGLLDPTQGRVLLNGQDIRSFNRRDYYSLFTAVFQDFSRLQVTVAQNIAQRIEGIDKEHLTRCIALAGLTEVVDALPQGRDTMLGKIVGDDGVELSGGQLQRLMLARALYKDAPILLLDEPTAALDPIAEDDIYQRYHSLTHGRTSVYISHRLASTRFCDRIIYLENGRIAEEGTHQELMSLGGGYCNLFTVQSKYYQEGEGCYEEENRMA